MVMILVAAAAPFTEGQEASSTIITITRRFTSAFSDSAIQGFPRELCDGSPAGGRVRFLRVV